MDMPVSEQKHAAKQECARSFDHLDVVAADQEALEWLQQTADIDLLTSTGDRLATHGSCLILWRVLVTGY